MHLDQLFKQYKSAPIGYPEFLCDLIEACLSNESKVAFECICEALKDEDLDDDWQIKYTIIEKF